MPAEEERPKEEEGKTELERDDEERGREGREGRGGRKKEIQTDRQRATQGWERKITHNLVLLMCGSGTVDTKHSLIQKHKEPFALADIINFALSSTKTEMKRGNHVLHTKSCQ